MIGSLEREGRRQVTYWVKPALREGIEEPRIPRGLATLSLGWDFMELRRITC